MRELPILFSGEMVKAILDGRKCQTRRIIKPQPLNCPVFCYAGSHKWMHGKWWDQKENAWFKPAYHAGDILYVRETWCRDTDMVDVFEENLTAGFYYKADNPNIPKELVKWHPSLHMPKSAARIWLEVTDVRVERLIEITEEDAKAEGAKQKIWYQPYGTKREEEQLYIGDIVKHEANYLTGFAGLWDSLCDQQENSFYSSPWVWVYGLKRLEGYR